MATENRVRNTGYCDTRSSFIRCHDCPPLFILYKRQNAFQQRFVFILALTAFNPNLTLVI